MHHSPSARNLPQQAWQCKEVTLQEQCHLHNALFPGSLCWEGNLPCMLQDH